MRLRRYLRTPKGLLLAILLTLTTVSARAEGFRFVAPGLLGAVGAAVLLDSLILRLRRGRWTAPDGALLTGLLIGGILSSFEPWYIAATAAVVAIATKQLLRAGRTNIFNPAALGLVAVFHLFDAAQNWWGAMPAIVPAAAWPPLLASAGLVAHRVNRLALLLAFTTTFFSLSTAAAFVVDPADVSEVFVAPDLLAIVYFAGFMLTDPPTSPGRPRLQLVCGALVGCVSVAVFVRAGAADYLLVGGLAGNLFEAMRHQVQRRASA